MYDVKNTYVLFYLKSEKSLLDRPRSFKDVIKSYGFISIYFNF